MSNYSESEGSVRVDVFKPSGKWYTTIAVQMGEYYTHPDLHQALLLAMSDGGTYHWYESDYQLICLFPFHNHSHPISVQKGKYHDPPLNKK